MTTPWRLQFSDSELAHVQVQADGEVRLRLSAAALQRPATPPAHGRESGHGRGLLLVLSGGGACQPQPGWLGRVADGVLLADGQPLRTLPVPGRLQGRLVLSLDLANGEALRLEGTALALRFDGPPNFSPSMAC